MTVAQARRSSSESSGQQPASRLFGAIFPGERRVWLIAGAVLAAMLVAIAVALLQPRDDLLSSNSVGARSATVILPAHTPLCVPRLRVPAGTGQVRFNLSTRSELLPALEVVIHEQGGGVVKGSLPSSPIPGHRDVSIPVPRFASQPESVAADVCLISAGEVFAWGNDNLQANVPAPTLGGVPQHNRVAVWFLGPAGQRRSILSQLGEMFRRAALFRAGFVGAWTYWVLFGLVFPALAYGAIRLLAGAEEPRKRRVPLPVMVGIIAFGVAASWALVTPAFQSPDESEHFAYAQYFAETGRAVETTQSARPVYSDTEGVALEAVKHDSVIELVDARPPWLLADERRYDQEVKALGPEPLQDNGGGFHPATAPHTPAYYSLLAPAYFLTRTASPFSQLFAMRLTSALLGALTAVLAMLIAAELLPGRRALACAAGLLVAFAPMFGFISGAVNNDNGVNLATALLVYLVVRSLRRGLTPVVGVALGATLVAGPLLKGTAYAALSARDSGLAAGDAAPASPSRTHRTRLADRNVCCAPADLGRSVRGPAPHHLHDPWRQRARHDAGRVPQSEDLPLLVDTRDAAVQAVVDQPQLDDHPLAVLQHLYRAGVRFVRLVRDPVSSVGLRRDRGGSRRPGDSWSAGGMAAAPRRHAVPAGVGFPDCGARCRYLRGRGCL